ncbi:ThiF family adenylyltransferase [Candidatus Marithioploca araucensis]|uniref:ThiF family adenylyltransferase n=1 Tax=Candidatus Marithioploca araucensis TaxID=70273 RepID=A0ABT7VUM7_9GAMM|nr:ThiF family adenylyltransferase [Thiotrichales bacterium HSG14]MDM8563251.1 ThiF family adenylyltransferase [Candidatus Marithioploca araucensis]
MPSYYHERLYRSAKLMTQMRTFSITLCGAGAIGSNMAENLVRAGFETIRVIDYDRVEQRNLSIQPYYRSDIGAYKATILANSLYRALGVEIEPKVVELTSQNVTKLLKGSQLVIDGFDNHTARAAVSKYCHSAKLPCMHVGLANDYAEIIWNDEYRVPSAALDDVCDYPLARNLVLLTIAVASEVVIAFVKDSTQQKSLTVTLQDFAIKAF